MYSSGLGWVNWKEVLRDITGLYSQLGGRCEEMGN